MLYTNEALVLTSASFGVGLSLYPLSFSPEIFVNEAGFEPAPIDCTSQLGVSRFVVIQPH